MGRYGLRIFTGQSAHNGEGVPGFYPRESEPCAPVSVENPFKIARFLRQYSWRNGKNGECGPRHARTSLPRVLCRPTVVLD